MGLSGSRREQGGDSRGPRLRDVDVRWEMFFSCSKKPVAFDFHDVKITAGKDVAFATAIGQCEDVDSNGKREDLEFRLTMCFRKIDGRWRVVHEHHSLPAE